MNNLLKGHLYTEIKYEFIISNLKGVINIINYKWGQN